VRSLSESWVMSNIQEPTIIYSVTDGLRSKHTKDNYRKFFSYFLKDEQVTEAELLTMALQNPQFAETHVIGSDVISAAAFAALSKQ
jgi:hypothetical protein